MFVCTRVGSSCGSGEKENLWLCCKKVTPLSCCSAQCSAKVLSPHRARQGAMALKTRMEVRGQARCFVLAPWPGTQPRLVPESDGVGAKDGHQDTSTNHCSGRLRVLLGGEGERWGSSQGCSGVKAPKPGRFSGSCPKLLHRVTGWSSASVLGR